MPLSIECPECRATYRVKDEYAGKKARCSKCNHVFPIGAPPREASDPGGSEKLLIACPYCSFQDFGNFCSECGGPLRAIAVLDFDGCKILSDAMASLCADRPSLSGERGENELDDKYVELQDACDGFNRFIDELNRAWRYEVGASRKYRFDRANVAEHIDEIPRTLPGRQGLVDRLWILVGQAEREIAQEALEELVRSANATLETGEIKRLEKTIAKIRELVSSATWLASSQQVANIERGHQTLLERQAEQNHRAEFDKLLTKGDKFAFLAENKKAIKAYEECLFWLSRNQLTDIEELDRAVRQKLDTVQDALST